MKFSILLPTRSRLDLLKLAIESVRMQDYAEWEIIVSDNASDADVVGYVQSLGDARIRAQRIDLVIPVTDNWNAALELANGDYFVMLGDDDALLPGALSRMAALIETWRRPEAVYAQAVQYAYPDVIPGHPESLMQTGYNEFLEGWCEPFLLPRETALRMVRGAMGFRILYGYNMQHFVVSRALVERLRGKGAFFQSPYPDYYAANAVLLSAAQVVATPDCFALIGISPKSFGFYYLNEREQDGVAFLENLRDADVAARVRAELIPGSNLNDSWLCAMETLASNFPEEVGSAVKHARYRRLQYHELLKAKRRREVLRHMRWWEAPIFGSAALAYVVARTLPARARAQVREWLIYNLFSPSPRFDPKRRTVSYRNILEAARSEVH